MPTLEWIGKDKVINHHLEVPFRVLDRKYSYDETGQHAEDNGSENMIIKGDNLEALKALLPRFEGKVDCIYIDPPYNTGIEKWVYNDNVNDPKIRKWLGDVVGKEGEDLTRHDKWLCMMYPRLKLLQRLLSPNGVIFISIDNNEQSNLKQICDEIFGSGCFVSNIAWQRTYSPRNDSKGIPSETDWILVYGKAPGWNPRKLSRTETMDARYASPDGDPRAWTSGDASAPGAATHPGMVYAIQHPITGDMLYPTNGRHWSNGQPQMLEIMNRWAEYELKPLDDFERRVQICGSSPEKVPATIDALVLKYPISEVENKSLERYKQGCWPELFFTGNGRGGIRLKRYLDEMEGRIVTNLWPYTEAGHTDEATKEQKAIFGGKSPFETPKPSRLIERVLEIGSAPDSIILDSFAGTGTTAHAVLSRNRKDGGRRRFILIEMEDYAEAITAERVKRVISGYDFKGKQETEIFCRELNASNLKDGANLLAEAQTAAGSARDQYDKISKPTIKDNALKVIGTKVYVERMDGLGGNFSFYELGEPLLIGENLNESVGVEKIREYVWFMETKQPFSEPQNPDNAAYLGTFADTAYYFHYEKERATILDHDFLSTIQNSAPGFVIYADLNTLSEEELKEFSITFKKIPRDIAKL